MRADWRAWAALVALSVTACAGDTGENKPATQAKAAASTPAGGAADAPPTNGRGAPDSTVSGERPVILFLGTSLTAGLGLDPDSAYPARIQRKADSAGVHFEVVNAGVSGETSAGLLRRLDWVLRRPASVIVVETGANDGLRGQPVSSTQATIGKILDRIAAEQPTAKVLLVQMEAPTNLGARYTRAFHDMFPALAREHGVTLLPFLLDSVAGIPSLNQADGIHPNDKGEAIVAENVWRGMERELKAGSSKLKAGS
jgi:acyl-CoA thioesterase-1